MRLLIVFDKYSSSYYIKEPASNTLKHNTPHEAGHSLILVARGGIEPPTKRILILPLDYFQLRFNFFWEAAQSRK